MAISVQQLSGKIEQRTITRAKRDIKVLMLIASDGQEHLLRSDKEVGFNLNDYLNLSVEITAVVDGSFYIPSEITIKG
jgi:hypothetical protein